jgi:deoxyadenosine/deoxycytidine kinase
MSFHISLEGNIGVGKTTILDALESENVEIIFEPVEYWRNSRMLEKFYNQPSRWAFTFQTMILNSFYRISKENECNSIIKFTERSLLSARYCFSKLARENGYLNEIEYQILEQSYELVDKKFYPNFIIYLCATPETVYQRIKTRGRAEESNITLSYLEKLDNFHKKLFIENYYNLEIPVLTVDANRSLNQVIFDVKNIIEDRLKLIQK